MKRREFLRTLMALGGTFLATRNVFAKSDGSTKAIETPGQIRNVKIVSKNGFTNSELVLPDSFMKAIKTPVGIRDRA